MLNRYDRSSPTAGEAEVKYLDGDFRVLYSVRVPFAGAAADDETVTLTLVYSDGIDDVAKLAPPPAGATNLVIPTARDVRVRLYPQCVARANYYAADEPPLGLSSDYIVRKDAAAVARKGVRARCVTQAASFASACFLAVLWNSSPILRRLALRPSGLRENRPPFA